MGIEDVQIYMPPKDEEIAQSSDKNNQEKRSVKSQCHRYSYATPNWSSRDGKW